LTINELSGLIWGSRIRTDKVHISNGYAVHWVDMWGLRNRIYMSMATPFIVLIWVPSDMIDINTKKMLRRDIG
jgi:hypothetical protein